MIKAKTTDNEPVKRKVPGGICQSEQAAIEYGRNGKTAQS